MTKVPPFLSCLLSIVAVTHAVTQPQPVTQRIASATRKKRKQFVIDSGASVHCVNDMSLFETIYENHPEVRITVANKQVLVAQAVGTVRVPMTATDGSKHDVVLHNVVYHPHFHTNLLSVKRLWKDSRMSTKFASKNVFKDVHTGRKFMFEQTSVGYSTTFSATKSLSPEVIHSRFGHCGVRRIRMMRERCEGFPHDGEIPDHDPSNCDACKMGASRAKHFVSKSGREYTYFGEKLSSDLCGPMPKSIEGYKYMFCIVDAYTNWLVQIPLKSKSSEEVKLALERFLSEYKQYLPTDGKPVTWHTDCGGEFMSRDLDEFCHEKCVSRSYSVPYEPPRNAHAERMWGIILRTTRVLLAQSGVHESLWPYATTQATMLHNYLPSTSLPNNISPYEALTHKLPSVRRIRTWGCLCWYYVPQADRVNE